jgi:acyl carrier protein
LSESDASVTGVTPLTTAQVHALVRRHAPSFWRGRPIRDELRLDDAGIGFDSVGLVELLVACEAELGVALPGDLLLEEGMTVGALVERLRRAVLPTPT